MTLLNVTASHVRIPLSGDQFKMPVPPTPLPGDTPVLAPNPVLADNGKDRFRPWDRVVAEGVPFFANGWDRPWLWDRVNYPNTFLDLGSDQPTEFSVALTAVGSGYLEVGESRTYYVCWREPNRGRETAPQVLPITNGTANNEDVVISASGPPPEGFTHVAIYRDTLGDSTEFKVDVIPFASLPYTDSNQDDDINGNLPIIRRVGLAKPPRFVGLSSFNGRTFGWTGEDSNLYYSQRARTDGEFVCDDFEPIPVQVGPIDNYGPIVAVIETYAALIVFKGRAAYELTGDDPTNFQSRILFDDRGCVGNRAVVAVDNFWAFLDEQGLMIWTPGAEPIQAGTQAESHKNPLATIWARMNRDAAHLTQLIHNEQEGTVEGFIALDYDPIPSYRFIYNYRFNVFESVDVAAFAMASGRVDDASGREYMMRLDDLGFTWQEYAGNSEGAYSGQITHVIDSLDGPNVIVADTFDTAIDGIVATPYDVYDGSGDVLGVNRVASVIDNSTFVRCYADPSVAGNQLAFGVIPMTVGIPRSNFGSDGRTRVSRGFIDHDVEPGDSLLLVESKVDQDPWKPKRELPLNEAMGHSVVTFDDSAFRWEMRVSQRYPGMDVSIRAIYVEALQRRYRQKKKT